MRLSSFVAITLLALALGACEDHHNQGESAVQAVQNLQALQTRSPSKTYAFDEALGDDGSTVVRSIEDCETGDDAATCTAMFADAQAEHLRKAPRFADQQSCEAFYGAGRCEEVPPGQTNVAGTAVSVSKRFVPVMQGYVVGRSIRKPVPIYFGRPTLCAQNPLASGCKGSSQGSSEGKALMSSTSARPVSHAAVTAAKTVAKTVATTAAKTAVTAAPRPTTVTTPIRLTAASPAPKVRPRSR